MNWGYRNKQENSAIKIMYLRIFAVHFAQLTAVLKNVTEHKSKCHLFPIQTVVSIFAHLYMYVIQEVGASQDLFISCFESTGKD